MLRVECLWNSGVKAPHRRENTNKKFTHSVQADNLSMTTHARLEAEFSTGDSLCKFAGVTTPTGEEEHSMVTHAHSGPHADQNSHNKAVAKRPSRPTNIRSLQLSQLIVVRLAKSAVTKYSSRTDVPRPPKLVLLTNSFRASHAGGLPWTGRGGGKLISLRGSLAN